MADLRGRVALVTGASSGIGEATARLMAAAGMRVALCARRTDRLERLAGEIRAGGGEAAALRLDVTDAPAVAATVEAVRARWGRIDVLMNNAGRGLVAPFEQTAPGEFRDLLELHLLAAVTATRAVLPLMRRQGAGHIVNVASVVARRGVPYRAAYGASKFALVGLSETLRVELRGTGIAVSVVYPGATATEFARLEARRAPWRQVGYVQSAEAVARAILRCLHRPRPEVYPLPPLRLLAVLSVLSPRLADLAMARFLRMLGR